MAPSFFCSLEFQMKYCIFSPELCIFLHRWKVWWFPRKNGGISSLRDVFSKIGRVNNLIVWSQVDDDWTLSSYQVQPQILTQEITQHAPKNEPLGCCVTRTWWSTVLNLKQYQFEAMKGPKVQFLCFFPYRSQKTVAILKYMKQHQWILAIVEEILEFKRTLFFFFRDTSVFREETFSWSPSWSYLYDPPWN